MTDTSLEGVGLDPGGRLQALTIDNKPLPRAVQEAVVGSPTISLTTSEVSAFDVMLDDPDFELLKAGTFGVGADLSFATISAFTITTLEVSDDAGAETLAVTALSAPAQRMRETTGALMRKNVSPTRFVEDLCADAGMGFLGQPSPSRAHISRRAPKHQDPESSWDCVQRLAGELGFIAFETRGHLIFGKPSWIVTEGTKGWARSWEVSWPGAEDTSVADVIAGRLSPLTIPRCRRSTVEDPKAQIDFDLPLEVGFEVNPGDAVTLNGVPTFDDRIYMVSSVSLVLDDGTPATIEAVVPVDPVPTRHTKDARSRTTPTNAPTSGSITVDDLIAQLRKWDDQGAEYQWGDEGQRDASGARQFDCSGFIDAGMVALGASFPRYNAQGLYDHCIPTTVDQAMKIRGALMFQGGATSIHHVMLSLGNGNVIEALHEAPGGTGVGVWSVAASGGASFAGYLPELDYTGTGAPKPRTGKGGKGGNAGPIAPGDVPAIRRRIMELWGPDHGPSAIKVFWCESRLGANVDGNGNPTGCNASGQGCGVTQVNPSAHPQYDQHRLATDPAYALRAGYEIWKADGWGPWYDCAKAAGLLGSPV